ncbi:tRNA (adenosine(37)-N6)-threonylcarbamoyltransferase complex dimerization subunit type 1 TsaB [Paenibacillus sp. P25]|nr:tRNA (adenosine(37)-N6)-threonylcarbamoyltransferase complex dimerization subunit type 1 TsaB [Paenibacillus sp. P25]
MNNRLDRTKWEYTEDGLLLSIDTSTPSMTVALSRGGELLGEYSSRAERNHSLYLVPAIEKVMEEAGVRPRDLSAVASGIGPGSYTGIRIGVTVAKTYAWTHKLALLGVSTLEAIALGGVHRELASLHDGEEADFRFDALSTVSAANVWVVPLIDARRGQVFTGLYGTDGGWNGLVKDGIRLMTAWTEELSRLLEAAQRVPERIIFTGELELHLPAIRTFAERWSGKTAEVPYALQARYTAELARRHWRRGELEDTHTLVPNYTQLAEAEAKPLAKKS